MNSVSDWSLWRSFAAVAASGSLSGAARKLGISQPTVGRHIEALETQLGMRLFERSLSGLAPTERALRIYEPVEAARLALAEAEMRAAGAVGALEGSVRITASIVTSHYTLPPMLARLREAFPSIALELVPSDAPGNLLMREADIAVRMFRPTQPDLITRKLGETPIIACAARSYLARRGFPVDARDLTNHDLIGYDREDFLIREAERLGFRLTREDFTMRCDSSSTQWQLMREGLGIGFAQANLVADDPEMVALDLDMGIRPLEVWLTTHRELHVSRRIRVIYDRLADMLGTWLIARG
jgi:DNA-binding transcriptional LysR family regulator